MTGLSRSSTYNYAIQILLAQFLIAFGCGPSRGAGITAVSANDFLSSLGVVTHIDQGVSGTACVEPLRYLGVRNIRDGASHLGQILLVHRQTGVRVNLVSGGDIRSLISSGKTMAAADALMAFEGPNEPNNFPINYEGQRGGSTGSWKPVAEYQRVLYKTVKSDPDLRGYPVFSVSEAGAETDNVGLQFLTIPAAAGATFPDGTQYADFANVHNYVVSNRKAYVDNQAWNAADPTLNGPWDGLFVEYGVTWLKHYKGYTNDQLLSLPRVTTETGWDSASDVGGEETQAKVLVNTYLSQFKQGWRYTFVYHLRDGEGGSEHQGLFNPNSTPKLAATYIHNLTSILADDRPVASRGQLNYSMSDQPATVHDLLLQKSSGVFELAVWDENVKGADHITLNLGGSHSRVKVYDVSVGIDPVQTLVNVSSLPLTLSDHAMVIEIAD